MHDRSGRPDNMSDVPRLEPSGSARGLFHVAASLVDRPDGVSLRPPLQQRLEESATQDGGDMPIVFEDLLFRVTRIPGKDLIAPVACEQMVESMLGCKPCAIVERQGGRIAERLVVGPCDVGKGCGDIRAAHHVFVPGAAKALVRNASERELVVGGVTKADRERIGRARSHFAQHAGYGRAVEPAAQERTRARIWPAAANGDSQRAMQLRLQLGKGGRASLGKVRPPVALDAVSPALENGARARTQLADADEHRVRRGHHVHHEIVEQRLSVQAHAHRRRARHSFSRRAEHEGAVTNAIGHPFDAHRIDRQNCQPPSRIEQGDCEATGQAVQKCSALVAVRCQQHGRRRRTMGAVGALLPDRPALQREQGVIELMTVRSRARGSPLDSHGHELGRELCRVFRCRVRQQASGRLIVPGGAQKPEQTHGGAV